MLGKLYLTATPTRLFTLSAELGIWNDGRIGGKLYGTSIIFRLLDNAPDQISAVNVLLTLDESRSLAHRLLRAIGEPLPTPHGE